MTWKIPKIIYKLTVKFPNADEGIKFKSKKEEIMRHNRRNVSIHPNTGGMFFIDAPLKNSLPSFEISARVSAPEYRISAHY